MVPRNINKLAFLQATRVGVSRSVVDTDVANTHQAEIGIGELSLSNPNLLYIDSFARERAMIAPVLRQEQVHTDLSLPFMATHSSGLGTLYLFGALSCTGTGNNKCSTTTAANRRTYLA